MLKVMVVGAGKLGYKLAEAMNYENIDVTLVDVNNETLDRISGHLDVLTVRANGIQVAALEELNIKDYNLLISTTNSDEVNTLICTLAKKLGCKKTIARIRNPEFIEQLDFVKNQLGIDYVINPDLATANEIERYISKTYNFYTGDFAKGKVSIVDFHIKNGVEFIGKQIKDLKGFDKLLITSISRDGELIIPNGSTILEADDVIHIIGANKNIKELGERIGINISKRQSKKVMILGGGNIGYYLAQRLEKLGISSTIIEKKRERSEYLAEKLDHTLIINGDGTDIDLLSEEEFSTYDTFVGVTGLDEQNLLMALVAKQAGVNKTIAKISRANYTHIVDKLDIDVALNPVNISVSNVLKFIRGGKVVSVSLLLGGEGEVTEIIVDKNSSIINKPLIKLGLPKGIIIGAIVHNGEVIIPKGNSVIKEGDRIIVFTLSSNMPVLNKIIGPRKKGGLF